MTDQPDLFEDDARPAKESPGPAHRDHTGKGYLEVGAFRDMVNTNFLQYASYVIKDRAIPDLDDGLKPVQRRILHALFETDDGKFTKVANIVGHAMQYHPHGDASIADALVNLVNKRYLVEGQGNFGNIFTGDPAAASRYIECRLTELARSELFNPDLTEFVPNYDGRRQEPLLLPAKIPLVLLLGAEGIAVGLSTKILPHNFCEVLQAQIAVLQKKPFTLLPDFQQGAVMDASEYDKGNGKIRLRAVIEPGKENEVIVREIPFGTTTESVMASIEEAARKKKISVKSIDDFTAANVEIRVKFTPGQDAEAMVQKLYAFTLCESSVSSRILVIRDRRPVQMDVEQVVRHCTKQLVRILKRELELQKRNLLEEQHRMTLVQLFVENRIYKDIEECKTLELVQKAVLDGVNRFRERLVRDVTLKDVEMLLGIQIRRISLFDMDKNRRDIEAIVKELETVEANLADLRDYCIRYLRNLVRKYGPAYPRLTKIEKGFETHDLRELTAEDLAICLDREKGYVGHDLRGENLFNCSPKDRIVVVLRDGRYQVMHPPDRFYVGENLLYAGIFDRDRIFTVVYEDGPITYMKKFKFGGAILDKEYLCTPANSNILLFSADQPAELFVHYAPEKRQKIHQQVFKTGKLSVRSVKALGVQMTVKKIASIDTVRPAGWDSKKDNPDGALMDFL